LNQFVNSLGNIWKDFGFGALIVLKTKKEENVKLFKKELVIRKCLITKKFVYIKSLNVQIFALIRILRIVLFQSYLAKTWRIT